MKATKNITLDLLETGSPVIIKAKQTDRNTRYIAAHLYVDGLAYPVPSGTEIAFRYKKPDGTAGFYDALPNNSPAITISGNTVTVELVEQVLTAAGCVHCEINMYNAASEKLTTFTFEISVEESVLTDAEIISSDYYNVLTAEITKALQAVTDATEQAENAAQSAQEAADSASMSKDWAAGQPVTYSGAPVSIAYAGAQRIASITAYGENAQGGTTEAPVALTGVDNVFVGDNNLLPKATETRTLNGVTFTPNPDGSVSVSGTATNDTSYPFKEGLDDSLFGQTVCLSGGSIQTQLVINEKKHSGEWVRNVIVNAKIPAVVGVLSKQADDNILYGTIYVPTGTTVNTTIYPMLNLGNTAMPYEPYQGSVTPLPIPRPLHKVGDVRDVCRTRVKSVYDKRIVLDGAEDWKMGSAVGDGAPYIFCDLLNDHYQAFPIISSRFPSTNILASNKNQGIGCWDRSLYLRYDSLFTNVEELKTYLSAHPLTVYYQSTAYDGTNGLDICLTGYQTGYIESYADESITTAWISSTGALSTGAEVAYVLSSPETYATDPVDFDNTAGPLTVLTGGEVEVRMTELIGSRSPELTGKMDKAVYAQVGNPSELDNDNFLHCVNQRNVSGTISAAGYFIDRWKLISGTVQITENGLVLNGKISQILENAAGTDVTASASAGAASYDNSTKTFTLTATGQTITWAKLEKGSVATPYVPKGYGAELVECYRYFWISSMPVNIFKTTAGDYFRNTVYFPIAMRTVPSVTILSSNGTVSINAVTIDAVKFAGNGGNDTVTSFFCIRRPLRVKHVRQHKKCYDMGLWSAAQVRQAVLKNIISETQYKEITSKTY